MILWVNYVERYSPAIGAEECLAAIKAYTSMVLLFICSRDASVRLRLIACPNVCNQPTYRGQLVKISKAPQGESIEYLTSRSSLVEVQIQSVLPQHQVCAHVQRDVSSTQSNRA